MSVLKHCAHSLSYQPSAKITGSNMRNDPETIAEVYLRISNDYYDSPDLRVQWLENLAQFQIEVINQASF